MQARIYISFFLLSCFGAFQVNAQQVLLQLGSEDSESWDAIDCGHDNACLFALGFQWQTEVKDVIYTAQDRDVLLLNYGNDQLHVWGQLSSASNTQIRFLDSGKDVIYLGGNAFSYLVYRGDTLFSDPGVNKAFILKLNAQGQFIDIQTIDARASAICIDAWVGDKEVLGLFEVNDSVMVEGQTFIPQAASAALMLQWNDSFQLKKGHLIDGTGNIKPVRMEGTKEGIFIGGNFRGSIRWGEDSIYTRTADDDVFLAKWDRSGNETDFLKHISGVYQDELKTMAVEKDRILLGGQFIGAISFEDIQIITGLSTAGFIGAFHTNGEALWLKGLFGNSDLTSVEFIQVDSTHIRFSALVGESVYYERDTLPLPWKSGEVHSVVAELTLEGVLKSWKGFEGDPIALVSALIQLNGMQYISMAFTGRFNELESEGGYDVLWLKDLSTSIQSVGIEEIRVYPNPVDRYLFFKKTFFSANYQVIDQHGRVINRGSFNGNTLELSDLLPGIYWLLLEGEKRYVAKFIKL